MKCPLDQTTLAITERQGIEIDYCPECRGVWLDRGELDKLIAGGTANAPQQQQSYDRRDERPTQQTYERSSQHHDTSHSYHKKKKKESWLEDIFDF